MNKQLDKCDFCRYWNGHLCLATPNLHYCQEAINEYFRYKRESGKTSRPVKSFRPWDKNIK